MSHQCAVERIRPPETPSHRRIETLAYHILADRDHDFALLCALVFRLIRASAADGEHHHRRQQKHTKFPHCHASSHITPNTHSIPSSRQSYHSAPSIHLLPSLSPRHIKSLFAKEQKGARNTSHAFLSLAGIITALRSGSSSGSASSSSSPSQFPSDIMRSTLHYSCGTAQVFHLLLY